MEGSSKLVCAIIIDTTIILFSPIMASILALPMQVDLTLIGLHAYLYESATLIMNAPTEPAM
jgi:hypothetical protein